MSCPSLSTTRIWAKSNFRPLPSYFPFLWTGTLNMNRGSLRTRSFRRLHFSVLRYRWTKNGFTGPKSFRSFRETGPSRNLRLWQLSKYHIVDDVFSSLWYGIDLRFQTWRTMQAMPPTWRGFLRMCTSLWDLCFSVLASLTVQFKTLKQVSVFGWVFGWVVLVSSSMPLKEPLIRKDCWYISWQGGELSICPGFTFESWCIGKVSSALRQISISLSRLFEEKGSEQTPHVNTSRVIAYKCKLSSCTEEIDRCLSWRDVHHQAIDPFGLSDQGLCSQTWKPPLKFFLKL